MKAFNKSINDVLPLLSWQNDCLVSKFADITMCFELDLPEVYISGISDFEAYNKIWVRAIRNLPDYTIVHKQDIFIENKLNLDSNNSSYLSNASNKHFTARNFLKHKCYLFITLTTKEQINNTSFLSILCKNRIVPVESTDNKRIQDFKDSVAQTLAVLGENGIKSKLLLSDDLLGTVNKSGIIEQYLSLDFSDKAVLADIHLEEKDFMVGDKYVSCYSITELENLPSEVYTHTRHQKFSHDNIEFPISYTSNLCLQLPFSHIYNQFFFLDSHKETIAKIEKRGREQQALSSISRENAINKTFNDNYLDEAVIHSRRSVRCAFNLFCWDENYLTLLNKNAQIAARFADLDCCANKTEKIVPFLFWAGIAGGESQYPSEMSFLSFLEQACCFINLETFSASQIDGFGIRLCDRINGVPLHIDISDRPREWGFINNRNKFILGPSGSGKSFFTNHLVRQYYEQDSHIVIVDVGDSYLGLCKLINEQTGGKDGIYYQYTEQNPISFNPFYVKDKIYTVEKKEQLVALVFCLWKNENEFITKAEETHIATAINSYLLKVIDSNVKASFNGFYEFLKKDFKQLLKKEDVKTSNFDIDNLLQVLKPYYKGGMYDYLLNAKENLDLIEKRFIVFEIDNIKDHKTLFPVVTLILMDTFISKMRHTSLANSRKLILIEEAWKAISKNGTAEFIKYLFKTVRKHFGEAIVVTQEVEDIIGNEIIKNSIISNADCKILLDQRKYANKFDEIKQILALTDKETAIALSLNQDNNFTNRNPYKEVFITLNGNKPSVYALEVSTEEYLVYTTEKTEKAKLLELEKHLGSIQMAISEYIRQQA